jgi:hypothetical protein
VTADLESTAEEPSLAPSLSFPELEPPPLQNALCNELCCSMVSGLRKP